MSLDSAGYRKWQQDRALAKKARESMMTKGEIIKEAHGGGMREYFGEMLGKSIAQELLDCGLLRTCLNCDEWNSSKETCSLVNKRPPAKIIVTGCEKHTDIIPF